MFLRYMRKLVARRRLEPRDDLITALIQAEEAGDKLTTDELLAMVFLLWAGGGRHALEQRLGRAP